MGNIKKYHYFVEGECEKKLINVLKEQKNLIIPGRVEILNVTQERLPKEVGLILYGVLCKSQIWRGNWFEPPAFMILRNYWVAGV